MKHLTHTYVCYMYVYKHMAMSNFVLRLLKHNLACITSNLNVCMWYVCILFVHICVKTRLMSDISFSHVPLYLLG